MSAGDHLRPEQFSKFVDRVHETGGATMDARSGRLVDPGKRGYMVGGESDKHGHRIPTQYVPEAEFGAHHVEAALRNINQATGGRARVNLGAWKDDGHVELDASARTPRASEAIRKGRNRGEKAIWSNHKMKEIRVK